MLQNLKSHQTKQYAFFRIPKELITNPRYKKLSTDAKLLYTLMLDRVELSEKNDWIDRNGNVYIYFTVSSIRESLCCSKGKAISLLAELDRPKGIGLIERRKQGCGNPDRLYVKDFMSGIAL